MTPSLGSTVLTFLDTYTLKEIGTEKFLRLLILSKEKLSMTRQFFISCVADDLSLNSSLFSIFYICPSSTRRKLSSLHYYRPQILPSGPQVPTRHNPARWLQATSGLRSGSAIVALPQPVPPARHGHLGDVWYITLFANLWLVDTEGFPEELYSFASSHRHPGSTVISLLLQRFIYIIHANHLLAKS